jgi:hypothetical protein
MLHLAPPHPLPLPSARSDPGVYPVLSDVVEGVQGDLQRRVLLLARSGTAEQVLGHRPAPRVVQGHRTPVADAARQLPQPLFVSGNGARQFYLIVFGSAVTAFTEVTVQKGARFP